MKNFIVLLTFVTCSISANAEKKIKPYSFKTAVVEYIYEGNITGTQTLYIDEYGWNQSEVIRTVTKSFGQKDEKNERKLTLGLDIYSWDQGAASGVKIRNTMLENLLEDPNFDIQDFAKRTMEGLGFQKTGSETFMGRDCEIWKGMGSTIWAWNGLALKTEIKLLGQRSVMTAINIKIDTPVPSDKFTVPLSIKFNEAGTTDPMEMMMKAMDQAEKENETPMDSNDQSEEGEAPVKSLKDLKGLLKQIK